jgi:DNA polymerase (family 10)
MTNAEAARLLARLATMLEIEDANPFRVRAYREGARIIESQGEPIEILAAQEGALEALPGIGKDLAQKIRDLVRTGTTGLYEEMKRKVPLEVVALTELQGLGPKRVKTVFEVLGVKDRAGLEAAAKAGKLRELPGFGERVEQNVLKALATASQWSGRTLLGGAWPVALALAEHIRKVPGVHQVENAGSFRRRKETVGDLDLLVTGGSPAKVMQAFTTYPDVAEVLGQGETKSSVRLRNGLQVDLRLVPTESFGAALLYFTGSKEHNIELRRIAIERGFSLNEYGLTRGQRTEAGRTEEEVYAALGLKWIPPELREATGEIELARFYHLPVLIEEEDLVADLHMHTDRSDGRDTLETMVRAARDRGYRYCAITEHSKSLTVARGFDEARVKRSAEEIAAMRRKFPDIRILHGLEVDILADGSLDLEDDGLAMLDWVIVSLHSRLDQPGPVVTERVLRAISHPAVCAMAHPTGRLIASRAPAQFDMDRVLERAAERGVAMEINSQPDRIDLKDSHARLAKDKGVRLVIDTDAHSAVQLENIRFGVFAARRAGLTRDDVLNTLPFERFEKALHRPGRPAAPPAKAATTRPRAAATPAPAGAPATTTKPRATAKAATADAQATTMRPRATAKAARAGAATVRRKAAKTGRGKATRGKATPASAASKPRSRARAAAKPKRGKKR